MDTTGAVCSAAVSRDEKLLSERYLDGGNTHSETLMPLVDGALADAGLDISGVELLAVTSGPGSFTGVRIGVCAAKGFAQTLKIPVAGINTLGLLKENVPHFDGIVCPMLDARRGEVYSALFRNGERISEDMAAPVEDVLKLTEGERTVFLGDGAYALKERILAAKPDALFMPPQLNFQRAGCAASIALEMMRSGALSDAVTIAPHYLRGSRVERRK